MNFVDNIWLILHNIWKKIIQHVTITPWHTPSHTHWRTYTLSLSHTRTLTRLSLCGQTNFETPKTKSLKAVLNVHNLSLTVRPLDTTCSSYLRYQGCYQCSVSRPGSSIEPVNLLSSCFGYCRPLVGLQQIQCDSSPKKSSQGTVNRIGYPCRIGQGWQCGGFTNKQTNKGTGPGEGAKKNLIWLCRVVLRFLLEFSVAKWQHRIYNGTIFWRIL